MSGHLYGIGLGPGDPELLTIKAVRLLQSADVVAYFAKAGRRGHARTIADGWLRPEQREMPLHYPITTEVHFATQDYKSMLAEFYAQSALTIAAELARGGNVALICEGDPLFYGSFMHLHARLRQDHAITIVPGVSGMSGCWSAAQLPMTWGDDVLTVLPGTMASEPLQRALTSTNAAVIMKIGRNFSKVRDCVMRAGLLDVATYVERGTMGGQIIMPLCDKSDDIAPYFAMVLIPGHGRRP